MLQRRAKIYVIGTLIWYPSFMSVEQVIMLFCEPEKDDYITAAAIRKEVSV